MAKQEKTTEVGLEGFDNLSKSDFIESVTEDTGRAMSSSPVDEIVTSESTGDREADKILATANAKEKAAKLIADNEEDSEADEQLDLDTDSETAESEEAEESKADEKDVKVDTKEKKKDIKVDDEEAEDDDKPLTFDNEEDKSAPTVEAEGGWKEVSKELFGDEDLKEDTFEAFKEKFIEKSEINLSKLPPETQRLVKFTEAGGTYEDFIEPFSKIDSALALTDADLIERHLKATGWVDDTKRANKLEQLADSGELEILAGQARKELSDYRVEKREEIIAERIKATEKYEARKKNAFIEEAKEIAKVLTTKKEFMATPVSDSNRERILKKYEAGEYDKDFKDPAVIADFLLYKEFGQKGITNLKISAQRELKLKHKEKFHNLPPKSGKAGSSRNAAPSGQDPEGNWDNLERERVQTTEE